jgi:site-specific recombinase XerD
VHLHGKGDKWRVCPLWPETAALLQQLLSNHMAGAAPDRPVFTSPRRTALTRFGIYKIVRRYTADIVKRGSDGQPRRVSPHTWRHSTAVHLLEAGVEVNVIRALARARESRDHKPLRRDHPPYEASGPRKV